MSGKKFLAMAERGEWTPIPERLPISGKRGCRKLNELRRRSGYLQQRLDNWRYGQDNRFHGIRQELASIEWIIKTFIMYEELLKKGPPEELEESETESKPKEEYEKWHFR